MQPQYHALPVTTYAVALVSSRRYGGRTSTESKPGGRRRGEAWDGGGERGGVE
jgi:hypothetical protein